MSMPISKSQIRQIHIMKAKLRLSDDAYRAMLAEYDGAASSLDLDWKQADDLCRSMESEIRKQKIAYTSQREEGAKRYDELKGRPGKYAAPKQLRMIEGMWCEVSIKKTSKEKLDALNKFLHNHFRISHITFVQKSQVEKIVKAIETMKQEQIEKQNAEHASEVKAA